MDALGLVLYFIISNVGGYAILEWRRDNYKVISSSYLSIK